MKVFSLHIQKLNYPEFIGDLKDILNITGSGKIEKNQAIIFTPNPEICLQSLRDNDFQKLLSQADYLCSDGIGLFTGYQIGDASFPGWTLIPCIPFFIVRSLLQTGKMKKLYGDRICGSDLTLELLSIAQGYSLGVAILDPYRPHDSAKIHSQEILVSELQKKYPGLNVGLYIDRPGERENIYARIQNSGAQIFFSTLGMKVQEYSVYEAMKSCPGLKLGLGVGSSFDYITGLQSRAPKWMRAAGIEWLYRIITGPQKGKRIRRLFQAVIVFPIMLCLHKNGRPQK